MSAGLPVCSYLIAGISSHHSAVHDFFRLSERAVRVY